MWLLLTFSFLLTAAAVQDDTDKILGGEECEPHSQPWQVALFERGRFNCGASLISEHWVLSAAHCQTRFMRARLGEHNLRKRDGPEQLRTLARIIPHPLYEAHSHRHDVMLLRLTRPARLSRQVRPVALPTRCPQPAEACVVSGWGLVSDHKPGTKGSTDSQVSLPDTLHCANISVIPAASCNKDYPGRLVASMLCAGAEGGGTESCERRQKLGIYTLAPSGAGRRDSEPHCWCLKIYRVFGGPGAPGPALSGLRPQECFQDNQTLQNNRCRTPCSVPDHRRLGLYEEFLTVAGSSVPLQQVPVWGCPGAPRVGAHRCPLHKHNYQLWLGRYNLFEHEDTAQLVQIRESFPHPEFNLSFLKNHTRLPEEDYSHDLMLLRLAEPTQITDAVRVLDLPTQEPQVGSTCCASGWGCIEPDKCMPGPDPAAFSPDIWLSGGGGWGLDSGPEGGRAEESPGVWPPPFFSLVCSHISR
ncbi:transmembrane protease serine 9 isoform X6 [Canis lupus familiaris]|uniref:transmembrane protease serine 9 isoform X6 n=1 Tax=Canis lupus familiaris TaxID=9615 RepID=UPI0018F62F4A|nr:transmembrane protease serine 9 isoform X6 [Canis lupus familiaris]